MDELDEQALKKMNSKNQTMNASKKIYDPVDSRVIDKKGGYSQIHNLPTEERKDDDKNRSPELRKSPSHFMRSPSFEQHEENFYPDSHHDDTGDSHEGEITMRSEVTVEVEDDEVEVERRSLTQKG